LCVCSVGRCCLWHVCAYLYRDVCMCVWLYVCMYVCVCGCMCVCMCVCVSGAPSSSSVAWGFRTGVCMKGRVCLYVCVFCWQLCAYATVEATVNCLAQYLPVCRARQGSSLTSAMDRVCKQGGSLTSAMGRVCKARQFTDFSCGQSVQGKADH